MVRININRANPATHQLVLLAKAIQQRRTKEHTLEGRSDNGQHRKVSHDGERPGDPLLLREMSVPLLARPPHRLGCHPLSLE